MQPNLLDEVFTRAEARQRGISVAALRRLVRDGSVARIAPGVYVDADVARSARADERTRHALAVAAWMKRIHGDCVATHESAAVLMNIALLKTPKAVTLTRQPVSRSSCASSYRGLRLRDAQLSAEHVAVLDGFRVTSAPRTVVDLARNLPFREAVVAADSCLTAGLATPTELSDVWHACSHWPGRSKAKRVLTFAAVGAETPLESLGRVLVWEQGLPLPELQVWVAHDIRVDMLWRAQCVVGEADGLKKYDEPGALRREKLRQERLEQMGFVVVRYTWADVTRDASRTGARLAQALQRGGHLPR